MSLRRRPFFLIFISLTYVAIALSIPLQVMWLYAHPIGEVAAIYHKLTWLNIVVIVGLLVNAAMLYQASPKLRFAVPFLGVLVVANNFAVGWDGADFSLASTSMASIGFLALNLPLILNRGLRGLIANPQLRWWRTAPRLRIQIPVSISVVGSHPIVGASFDLSKSGMFIPIGGSRELNQFGEQKSLDLVLKVDSLTTVSCRARIVRRAESRGAYPQGIGVEFEGLSLEQKRKISRVLDRHTTL